MIEGALVAETVVVDRSTIFRYPRRDGSRPGHTAAQGVPDDQLDWPV